MENVSVLVVVVVQTDGTRISIQVAATAAVAENARTAEATKKTVIMDPTAAEVNQAVKDVAAVAEEEVKEAVEAETTTINAIASIIYQTADQPSGILSAISPNESTIIIIMIMIMKLK